MLLTPNSIQVLESRYLRRNSDGNIVETPEQLFDRVARFISSDELRAKYWYGKYSSLLRELRFLPNTPTLINSGMEKGQLSACFVLPVGASVEAIFSALKSAAIIHSSGGGTGFSFSNIDASLTDIGMVIGLFDRASDLIKQAGVRRGANMGVCRVDHPAIEKFINLKSDGVSFQNFNISVAVTDQFMERSLDRTSDQARLFDMICEQAWQSGDPGLIFIDRMNRFNPTPFLGSFDATNPCGEQPLLSFESCNLGSLNLTKYISEGSLEWRQLKEDIYLAVRFLDSVIDLNYYPISETKLITLKNRKIGLGVMGWADALLMLGLKYGSSEARNLGAKVMGFVDSTAKSASFELAKEKGPFVGFSKSLWNRLGYPKMRNATVSTVAPTGTISIIAGCSSGIEPIFASGIERKVLDGQTLYEEHPWFAKFGRSTGSQSSPWQTAADIDISGHLGMQAAFQRHSDSAVSKTINLPSNATLGDVRQSYWDAYKFGCKGITVYRDGCKTTQVLNKVSCRTC